MRTLFRNDWLTITLAIIISLVGIISIISSEGGMANGIPILAQKQLIFLGLAFVTYLIFSMINYKFYETASPYLYGLSILILLLVLMFGIVEGGSRRWLRIGDLQLQPSEIAKVLMIIVFARIFTRLKSEFPDIANFLIAFASLIPVIFLILIEPDLGTSIVYLLIFLLMSFVSPLDWRVPVSFVLVGMLLIPATWPLLKDYQKDRIFAFVDPSADPLGKGYQSNQSKIAIGGGGLTGWGFGKGPQNKLNFIPSQTTDFIFTIVGEEGGFVFTSLVVLAYVLIFLRLGSIAIRAPDNFGSLIVFGICSMLFIQTVVNIGMTIGIMPVTGLPLPFMSKGGSSLLINFIALGIANSVYKYSELKSSQSKQQIMNVRF